jgi:methylenetetrahydrofolate--tRNA-(uracil-5-)-methyltransferase
MRILGCMLLECAEAASLPAGGALAVDRELFARLVTKRVEDHPNIEIVRQEIEQIPDSPAIIASGPLTSPTLSASIAALSSEEHLFFFDAIAPIVHAESVNMNIAFRASRYDKGEQDEGDYINCPFTKEEYYTFVEALLQAQRIELRAFEDAIKSGRKSRDISLRAVYRSRSLLSAESIRWHLVPCALLGFETRAQESVPMQSCNLRQDNLAGSLYNLVGFQTNLKFPEQKRVLRLIPGS